MNPINLVQVTDTHLFAQTSSKLSKINTLDTLNKVFNFIQCNEDQFDCLIATGDIAQDASLKAYQHFMLSVEKFAVPFRWIPGNHDNVSLMQRISYGTNYCHKTLKIGNWIIVLLDTSVKHEVSGLLSEMELKFLKTTLDLIEREVEVNNVLICLHHNPVEVRHGWAKEIGLRNSSDFFDVIEKFPAVRCAVFGHLHQEIDIEHKGIRLLCSPSTCTQFVPNAKNFKLDSIHPGYRRLLLYEDGSIDTKVIRLKEI